MRTMITTVGFTLMTLLGTAPVLAQCELSCFAECRQESVICSAAANLEGRIGRQQCASDAADAITRAQRSSARSQRLR